MGGKKLKKIVGHHLCTFPYTVSANAQTHQSGWKHLGQTEELIVVWPEGTVHILGQ